MSVHRYLDLATNYMTEEESVAIDQHFPALDEAGPRVIRHDYGWWVNVQSLDDEFNRERDEQVKREYPNFHACLEHARAHDCHWINFDQDGDTDVGDLPTFDW